MNRQSESSKITHKINALAILLDHHANKILNSEFAISYTEFLTLVGVYYLKSPSQKQLAEFTSVSKSMVSRTVAKFGRLKMLRASENKIDRRGDRVNLTTKGKALLLKASNRLESAFQKEVYRKIEGINLPEFEKALDALLETLSGWQI